MENYSIGRNLLCHIIQPSAQIDAGYPISEPFPIDVCLASSWKNSMERGSASSLGNLFCCPMVITITNPEI